MTLVRRILLLTLVSLSGVALLAPLAARSALPLAAPIDEPLLEDGRSRIVAERGPLSRGTLSGRDGLAGSGPLGGREAIEESAMPTPKSAPMEATLYSVAAPAQVAPAPATRPAATYDGDTVWDALAKCESGGNWSINTGNGYYGGLQFSLGTWEGYGGAEFAAYPHEATRAEQITVAERLRAARGYSPWPACSAKLGLG